MLAKWIRRNFDFLAPLIPSLAFIAIAAAAATHDTQVKNARPVAMWVCALSLIGMLIVLGLLYYENKARNTNA